MRFATLMVAAGAVLLGGVGEATAQGFDLSGFAAFEPRLFVQSPQTELQFSGLQLSGLLVPEIGYRTSDRQHQFKLSPFVRVDSRDDERTHFDLREAYWRTVQGDWEVLTGFNTFFWGVTESRHLVDVINQTDALEDIDDEDKLGQAMVNVGWQRDWGRLDAFLLLGFRERRFAAPEGRPGLPLPIRRRGRFPDGRRDVDLALRYSHYLGDWDVGVHLFRGTSREPAFVVGDDGASLVPTYRNINQAGLDLQYTRGAWLWKLEGIVREGEGRTFGAAVAGFEYTLYQLGGGAADLGLLAEFLVDGRDASAPVTPFDHDLFVGGRLALNDVQDAQVLAGAVIDVQDGSTAVRVEAERRISDHLDLELEGRFFIGVDPFNSLRPFHRDSFLNLRLYWFF